MIAGPVSAIVEVVKLSLEESPPELVADIMQNGITLAGGGALLQGLDRRLANETRMPVRICEDPLTAVARGCGRILEGLEQYSRILQASQVQRRVVV